MFLSLEFISECERSRFTSTVPSPPRLCPARWGRWPGPADSPPASPPSGLRPAAGRGRCAPSLPGPPPASRWRLRLSRSRASTPRWGKSDEASVNSKCETLQGERHACVVVTCDRTWLSRTGLLPRASSGQSSPSAEGTSWFLWCSPPASTCLLSSAVLTQSSGGWKKRARSLCSGQILSLF